MGLFGKKPTAPAVPAKPAAERWRTCQICNGMGNVPVRTHGVPSKQVGTETCRGCNGRGEVRA
jgi:DnaJ-class molecular chaperone